eukprot:3113007-Rhodomonas_salina.1
MAKAKHVFSKSLRTELSLQQASSMVQFEFRSPQNGETVYETGMCATILLEVEDQLKHIEESFAGYWHALDTAPQSAHREMQQKMYQETMGAFDYIMGVVDSFAIEFDDDDDE